MHRKIMWASQHLEIDTMTGKIVDPSKEEYDTKEEEKNEFYFDDDDDNISTKMIAQNVLSTPFGLWKVDDIMNPYKQFKLWMGHTNFTINKKIACLIKKIAGIEILSIITRYRFIIGVGEMFDIRDVRIAIEKELQCNGIVSTVNNEKKHRSKTQHN
jgi:hypothetical protein